MANIAFFHKKFPAGGAEIVTFDIASVLKDKEVKVFVFSNKIEIEKFPKESVNITPIILPFPNKDERNYSLVLSNIKEFGIDVLVIPADINYFPFIDQIKRDAGVKVVYVLHSLPFWEYKSKLYNVQRRIHESFLKRLEWYFLRYPKYKFGFKFNSIKRRYIDIYNQVDIFGVLSESFGRELAEKLGLEYSSSKIRVLPNYVKELADVCEEKQKEIYFIGRLTYVDKRVDRLLRIWSLVEEDNPEWNLKIVGTGEECDNLIKLKEELKLQRVSFLGFTTNPKEYYDRASIVCMTSSYEGWPMVLLEAQSNRCTTIAFNSSGGIEEILSPSWQNGVLVEAFDEKEYAQALSRLMNDDKLRCRIALNGQLSVKRFSPEKTLFAWKSLLEELKKD